MPRAAPPTIAVDARAAAEVPAGAGRVVRELLAALARRDDANRYELLCHRPGDVPGLDERFRWVTSGVRDPFWHLQAARRAGRADVLLSTNSYLTAWFATVPTAIVVYDLVAFIPEARPQRRAALIERATLRPALRRCAAALCISAATERDLLQRFPATAGRTSVMLLAADARFGRERAPAELRAVRERHELPEAFVLSVGTLEPRKNLERLVAAHEALPDALREAHPLVLVGPKGWEIGALLERLSARSPEVRVLGHVSDDDLAALYSLCTAFCYPSLYEGFGLPVLEAMSSGAPTITSNVSSLPEVGGEAVRYVEPRSVESIREALAEILSDEARARELAKRGRARAAGFSWDRTAEDCLQVLGSIARGGAASTRS
jgi:glycosyltransferase involved in cell wall biosynthesis